MNENAPEGSIIITPKEFYDGVQDDLRAIKDAVVGLPDRVTKLEVKIETLQNRVWFLGGFAAAAGAGVGASIVQLF